MPTTTSLTAILAGKLPAIDRYLADQDVPLNQRSIQAAMEFVTRFIEAVREPGQDAAALGHMSHFIATGWFPKLYAQVYAWYCDRFGAAFECDYDNRLLGLVSIAGTAFAVRVPLGPVRKQAGDWSCPASVDG